MFLIYAAAKGKKPTVNVDALDTIEELEGALKDIEAGEVIGRAGRNSSYWPKIRERLLKNSSSPDLEEAKDEWQADGLPYISDGTCELCDYTPIKYHFPIKNRVNGKGLVIGSECIHNYLEIDSFESTAEIKKRLLAQIHLLRKQERGEDTSEQLKAVGDVFETKSKVLRIIESISSGQPDLDILEYQTVLQEATHICNHLGIKNTAWKSAQETLFAITKVIRFRTSIKATQKLADEGLMTLAKAILAKRDPMEKKQLLEQYLKLLSTVAQYGPSKEVVSRTWGAIAQRRNTLLEIITQKCDKSKSDLAEVYREELAIASPYRHLKSILEEGLQAQRALFDSQLKVVEKAMESENFIDEIQKESSVVSQALNLEFLPDLENSDGSSQQAAAQVGKFLNLVSGGGFREIIAIVQDLYKLSGVRDLAGVKITLLRAANEQVVDADVFGKKSVEEFESLLRGKDKKALSIIEAEIDEVAALIKATGNLRVYEKMGQDLDFDVQKAYKLYTKDREFENTFCSDILQRWKEGRIRSLSAAQMGNIQKQITMKGRQGEVRNSMWDALRSELMVKVPIIR